MTAAPEADGVYEDIRREREAQDAEWGGPEHDDRHGPGDWVLFLTKHMGRLAASMIAGKAQFGLDRGEYRRALVRVAALAVAGVEWLDRNYPEEGA